MKVPFTMGDFDYKRIFKKSKLHVENWSKRFDPVRCLTYILCNKIEIICKRFFFSDGTPVEKVLCKIGVWHHTTLLHALPLIMKLVWFWLYLLTSVLVIRIPTSSYLYVYFETLNNDIILILPHGPIFYEFIELRNNSFFSQFFL